MTYRCVYIAPAYLYWANFPFNFTSIKWGSVGNCRYSYLIFIWRNLAISSKGMLLISEIWGLSWKVGDILFYSKLWYLKSRTVWRHFTCFSTHADTPVPEKHLSLRWWDVITAGRAELLHMPNLIEQAL